MPTSNASHKYLLGWKILLFLCFSIQREDHLPMKILECNPTKNREKKENLLFFKLEPRPRIEHNFIQMFVSVSTLFATTPLVSPRIDVWETTAENFILMTYHYPALGSTSDWLKQIYLVARPIRSPNQIWVMTSHQYGISALVRRMSFRGEISCGFYKCRLFLKGYVFH